MANNKVIANSGSPFTAATDEIGGVDIQLVKLVDGTEDSASRIPGHATYGLRVDPALAAWTKTFTPTISTSVYAAKDVIGTLGTLSDVARANGGWTVIDSITLIDKGQQLKAIDVVFADVSSITVAADNAAFDPTDADLTNLLAVIPITPSDYADFTDNSKAFRDNLNRRIKCGAVDDIFVLLIARGTPTYTSTSDLTLVVNGWSE